MPYTWLFFDADDTLFDYGKAEGYALSAALAQTGLPASGDVLPAYQEINQSVWKEFEQGTISAVDLRLVRFARLFERLDLVANAETFSQRYLAALSQAGFLIDGVEPLLTRLAKNYHLGLVTNGLPEVQRPRLLSSGIANFFEFTAISEEIGTAKPDPRFFQAALTLAGHPEPAGVLVIGDSLSSDIRGGCLAGLDTLWYNPARKPADPRWPATYEVQTLAEISNLLAP